MRWVLLSCSVVVFSFLPACQQTEGDDPASAASRQATAKPRRDRGVLPDTTTPAPDTSVKIDAPPPKVDSGTPPSPDTGTPPPPAPGTWITVAAGTFLMGSPTTEPCRDTTTMSVGTTYETQHQVQLTHTFEIYSTEVTQGDFQAVMGYNPAYFKQGDQYPVEMVSWHQAAAYCNKLSQNAGLGTCYSCSGSGSSVTCTPSYSNIYSCAGYRLPTEAEWEYAYRAGTTTAYYNGGPSSDSNCFDCQFHPYADPIGWHCGDSAVTYPGCANISWYGGPTCAGSHPVAAKMPNAWGLYDMAGNVVEWVNDWYMANLGSSSVTDPTGPSSGTMRVYRGSAWSVHPSWERAAHRDANTPTTVASDTGFRCARTR